MQFCLLYIQYHLPHIVQSCVTQSQIHVFLLPLQTQKLTLKGERANCNLRRLTCSLCLHSPSLSLFLQLLLSFSLSFRGTWSITRGVRGKEVCGSWDMWEEGGGGPCWNGGPGEKLGARGGLGPVGEHLIYTQVGSSANIILHVYKFMQYSL